MNNRPYFYKVVDDFERAIAKYTGSKYACAVNSCTNALLLCCAYLKVKEVTIPKRTYVGVPMSIIHAGGKVKFDDRQWKGIYMLRPYPIWDSARYLSWGMYKRIFSSDIGTFVCISLHWGKTLNLGQGGVILHDSKKAQSWFKRARFDGRTEGVAPRDDNPILGWHMMMSPADAAEALTRLYFLPKENEPLPNDDYPNLSKLDIFKQGEI